MATLQSSKSWSVYLLIFKVNQDSLDVVILAGLYALLCLAGFAELSWAYIDRVRLNHQT